jgi:hypothetical protein
MRQNDAVLLSLLREEFANSQVWQGVQPVFTNGAELEQSQPYKQKQNINLTFWRLN